MLSKNHVAKRCLLYNGHKTCRYLVIDQITGDYLCVKKVPGLKDEIDDRVAVFEEKAKDNGQDVTNLGRPIGDNCQGYLYLKNTQQGFDIPGSV